MKKITLLFVLLFLVSVLLILPSEIFSQDLDRDNKISKELINLETNPSDSPFGVLEFLNWNHDWNHHHYRSRASLEKAVALMKGAGISWIRVDFMWEDIEPREGRLNFKKYDDIVELLTENNINILGLLSYTASWAGPAWNSPPYDDETFVTYVANVIGRYKDKIKYWEIWNEPDDTQYWTPQDGMVRYTQLLQKAYIRAKEIDPECKILNGGLSKSITLSLRKIYKNGGQGYFDILATHPYVNPLYEIDVARLTGLYNGCKKIMAENGDDKKIWFTELGAPGVKYRSKSKGWWFGVSPTEAQQAAWVKRVYTEILPELPDCERIFWAFLRDTKGYWHNGIDYFGLVRNNFSQKPAFTAYKESVELWNTSLKNRKPKEKLRGISPW